MERDVLEIRIHGYTIGQELRKNKYSVIRKAVRSSNQKFHVRIVDRHEMEQSTRIENVIFNEMLLTPLLQHPNILDVSDIVFDSRRFYQFYKVPEYGDLLTFLKGKEMPKTLVVRVIDQLLSAIEYLHSLGICHNDIRPENILLGEKASVKLGGLSQATLTCDSVVKGPRGSYEYASPEATRKETFNGFQSDMWSLGVVIYVILARSVPFKSDGTPNIDYVSVDYSRIPPEYVSLVKSLLSVDPSKRPSIADIRSKRPFLLQEKPTSPLSTLRQLRTQRVDAKMMMSSLSQMLNMPIDRLKVALEETEMNREKLLVLLYNNKVVQPTTIPRWKEADKDVCVHTVVKFEHSGTDVFDAIYTLMENDSRYSISSPLTEKPQIVVSEGDTYTRIEYNISDDGDGNSVLMLSSDTKAAAHVGAIKKYLLEAF